MKKKATFTISILAILAIAGTAYVFSSSSEKTDFSPEVVNTARDLLAEAEALRREKRFEEAANAHNKALSMTSKDTVASILAERHSKLIKTIDDTTKYIRQGDSHMQAKRYEEAAEAYKQAYQLGGDYVISGLQLARMYEKLGRYDEGIQLLDEMISKGYLSEAGIENAKEIQTRLISARNQASSPPQ